MKYCSYCGKQMEDQARFCASCGKSAQVSPVPQKEMSAPDMTYQNKKNAVVSDLLQKITTLIICGIVIAILLQVIALFNKMPDSDKNYFIKYFSRNDEFNVKAVFVIVFSVATLLFFTVRKDYGITSLICSIVSCILVSSLTNAILNEWISESYGYYSKELIKSEMLSEGGAFGYKTLGATKIIILIFSVINCVCTVLIDLFEKKNIANDDSHWVCPSCGKVNPVMFKRCECGYSSKELMEKISNNSIPNGWKCSQCGKYNASYVGTCSCGNTKN